MNKDLPEIGKTYNCFDDGKITKSRMYQVTITEIIPFKKADKEILEQWHNKIDIMKDAIVIGGDYSLFSDKTDYFIKFASNEDESSPNGVFARTKKGSWYGLGNFFNSGLLDLDGKITDNLKY